MKTKWVCHVISEFGGGVWYYLPSTGRLGQVIRIQAIDAWQTSFTVDVLCVIDTKIDTYTLDMYDELILDEV